MSAILLDGKVCAQAVRAELKERIQTLAGKGIQPGLAVILVGDNPASASYVASKTKACTELGMLGETVSFPERVSQDVLLRLVATLNADARYHGILIQLPLPNPLDSRPSWRPSRRRRTWIASIPRTSAVSSWDGRSSLPAPRPGSSSCWFATE